MDKRVSYNFEKSEKFYFFENFEKLCENAPLKNFFLYFSDETGSNQRNLEQKLKKNFIFYILGYWGKNVIVDFHVIFPFSPIQK